MLSHNEKQLLKMAQHSVTCTHLGTGGFTNSFRLEQNVKTNALRYVKQIKCTGCGFSLDFHCEEKKTS